MHVDAFELFVVSKTWRFAEKSDRLRAGNKKTLLHHDVSTRTDDECRFRGTMTLFQVCTYIMYTKSYLYGLYFCSTTQHKTKQGY